MTTLLFSFLLQSIMEVDTMMVVFWIGFVFGIRLLQIKSLLDVRILDMVRMETQLRVL